jgi:hypothetical protein
MRIGALAAVGIAAVSLAACGTKSTNVSQFSGEQKNVAQVVAALQKDGQQSKPDDICSKLLASSLQERIKAAGSSCGAEMKKAIDDADAFDLEVRTVDVNGNSATATVHGSDQGKGVTRTFQFTKEGGQWRISDFGAG